MIVKLFYVFKLLSLLYFISTFFKLSWSSNFIGSLGPFWVLGTYLGPWDRFRSLGPF